jgi:hypothetical protein
MNHLTQPPVLAWLRTATPQLVEQARRAPMRFIAIPSRAAWLRDLRLELLKDHLHRTDRYETPSLPPAA